MNSNILSNQLQQTLNKYIIEYIFDDANLENLFLGIIKTGEINKFRYNYCDYSCKINKSCTVQSMKEKELKNKENKIYYELRTSGDKIIENEQLCIIKNKDFYGEQLKYKQIPLMGETFYNNDIILSKNNQYGSNIINVQNTYDENFYKKSGIKKVDFFAANSYSDYNNFFHCDIFFNIKKITSNYLIDPLNTDGLQKYSD